MNNKQIDYFEFAQSLFKKYSTTLSNENVKNKVFTTLEGVIDPDYFEKNNINSRTYINEFLLQYYPNETTIKSMFINKVLSKSNNHVIVFELNAGNSRVDLCKLNRDSTAFEIKTELDSPDRLEQQMQDYFRTFDRVFLICSENNIHTMITKIPEECGVYTYRITKSGRYIFKKIRKSIKSVNLSPYTQLATLTKKDLQYYYGCDYNISKGSMIERIMNFKSEKEINYLFKLCLKNKYLNKWNFFVENKTDMLEIDYQWFYKNLILPEIVYQ